MRRGVMRCDGDSSEAAMVVVVVAAAAAAAATAAVIGKEACGSPIFMKFRAVYLG